MQFHIAKKSILTVLLISCFFLSANAQETIQDQFDNFYEKETNAWQEYRMMKMPKLKEFWAVVTDTIKVKEQKVNASLVEIASLNSQLTEVNEKLVSTKSELAESEEFNNSIPFMGIQLEKPAYHAMVWVVILALMAGLGTLYLMYLRSNKITTETRLSLSSVEQEYLAHKDKARNSQLKLRRELQTALNTLHEHRIRI